MLGYYNMARPRRLQETERVSTHQKRVLREYYGGRRYTEAQYLTLRLRYNQNIVQIRQDYDDSQVVRGAVTGIFENVLRRGRAEEVLRRGVRRFRETRGSLSYTPQSTNAHEAYKNPIRNFRGRRIKITTLVDGQVLFSVVQEVPNERFNRWWDNAFFDFMEDSQNSKIARFEGSDIKIVITPNVELTDNRVRQLFAEGVSNCMLTPILDWATSQYDQAKSKPTKSRYNVIIKKLEKYEQKYPKGIPEEDIQTIADDLQVDISIEQPICEKQFIVCKSAKKSLRTFKFVNTRLNHIELNEVVNNDFKQVSSESLQEIAKQFERSNEYYDYKKDRNGRYTRVRSLTAKYQSTSDYNEAVNLFEHKTGLANCKIDHLNDPVAMFIKQGIHYNGTIDFNTPDDESISHIDMHRAYASFDDCEQCEGFVGKITDYRKTNKIVGIGYYRAYDFDWSEVDCDKLEIFRKMNCYLDHNVYPSVELKWLKAHGVKFSIEEGCWGTKINFNFTDEMLNDEDFVNLKNEKKVKFYAKWSGSQTSYKSYQSFNMKGSKEFFENMKAIVKSDCEIKCFEDGEGIIEYPLKHDFNLAHITGFITMYQRLTMFNQLFNMDADKIFRVCVDGIYYEEHEFTMIEPFRVKTGINFGNLPGLGYCSNVFKYGKYIDEMGEEVEAPYSLTESNERTHYQKELFKGAGGNGKTHFNLMDKGLVRMCYVAPSYKLIRAKQREYGVEATVLARVLHEEHSKDILKYNNVLILDEVSQYSEQDKQAIFNKYFQCKLIFCGDIGYQLPCISGIPMNETSFNNITEFTTNHRFTCDKHRSLCKRVRELMDEDYSSQEINKFIVDNYENIKIPEGYTNKDIILCSKHEFCNEWNDKFGNDKWSCTMSSRDYSKGDIVTGECPKAGKWVKRHGYTIHSVQGETYEDTIYIDARKLFDPTMGYTAISRARRWEQIKIII